MLWLIFLVLTLVVVAGLIYPLLKRPEEKPPQRIDFDLAVYRSQLEELRQEIESGVLSEDQADGARAEIQRRMLAAEDAQAKSPVESPSRGGRAWVAAIVAIAVIVPTGAAAFYVALGSPGLPGEPYASRMRQDSGLATAASADELARQLQASPSAAGYERLANMYFSASKYDQAADADHHAIDLGADDAKAWSEFGEAVVMADGGSVAPQALVAFINAMQRDPHDKRSRFYIGLAEAQIGNLKQAVSIWRDLEQDGAPNAPWLPMVREHITAFAKEGGFDPASDPPAPPSIDALRSAVTAMTAAMRGQGGEGAPAAAPPDMSASAGGDQDTMIRGMVAALAARMEKNPGDVDGWRRLAHAYNVLGEPTEARRAIDHAVALKPDDVDVQLTLAETQKAAADQGIEPPQDFVATLRNVLRLDPGNVQALYYVGIAEQQAGRTQHARAMWAKALTLASADDPLARDIRNRLDATRN